MYKDFREKLISGETTCSANLINSFNIINDNLNLNAFVSLIKDKSIERAAEIDNRIKNNSQIGKLAGMTFAIKDNIAVKGEGLTCGSKILENFRSLYSATVVNKLESEDAIILAKSNMDEFAMGSSGEFSYFGRTLNPHDLTRVPGGSSSGSGVSVAAGMTIASLGSETGGSVRQPASFLGLVGTKPTYGRVSRYGLTAFASSLDQVSPFTNCVYDSALIMEVISGVDSNDMTSSNREVPEYSKMLNAENLNGLKVGIPKEYFIDGIEPDILKAIDETKKLLVDSGAEVIEVSLPNTEYTIPCYYVIATAEASSNLARFDGARYGYRSPNAQTLEEMYVLSRTEGFGEEVKRRIMTGTFVLSSGYYDAYYKKAQQVRRLLTNDFKNAFSDVDVLLTPTAPTTSFKFGEKLNNPIAMYLSDIFTAGGNLSGVPAISIPCGKSSENNMPIGIQLITSHFREDLMFRVVEFIERNNKN
ncbi:MAG: Asp-tRNA(Asn)/Glu-tRNA(Gln) amidotransferase subunit GatA [Chlorobi bacterium]|nr:Asp-tRNA(Asn)/Glu-tRNA(Gln) amidotransferase subunit GatA [Chlorobiota bacterium]